METNLYRGSIETIILKLLHDHHEMYGYEITKKVKELSDGKLQLTEGGLYPLLHKMETNGIIEYDTRMADNRYRKYYKLSQNGQKDYQTIMDQMNDYLKTMQLLLNPSRQNI